MAKDREIQCIHYICEHSCDLGRDAVFRGLCQTCAQWKPKKGSKPARENTRKIKLAKIKKKEMNNY